MYTPVVTSPPPSAAGHLEQRSSTQQTQEDLSLRLPDELLLYLFSFLSASELNCASLTCKRWGVFAGNISIWESLAKQVFPQQESLLDVLLLQAEQTHLLRPLVDLQSMLREQFREATVTLCSIRITNAGTIVLVNLTQNGETQLRAYNLQQRAKVWRLFEKYVHSGGVARGQYSTMSDPLVLTQSQYQYFFTTHHSVKGPLQRAFSLYNLGHMDAPLATLNTGPGEEVEHIDSDPEANMFALLLRKANDNRHHILIERQVDGTFNFHSNILMLAFDPRQSTAIIHSLSEQDSETPLQLVRLTELNGLKRLNFYCLHVPISSFYQAQITDNHVAILTEGPLPPTLFLLKRPELSTTYKVATDIVSDSVIDSFILYDDYLVVLNRLSDDKPGPLTAFDLTSLQCVSIVKEPVSQILCREGGVLHCKTEKGSLLFDLKTRLYKNLPS